ncbi:MAG: MlaD family protein [Solirubrobacteraceae bacterium]|nr:MAG: hypothetical protein DLM63_11315 [Solirubrobacterales bacterium]
MSPAAANPNRRRSMSPFVAGVLALVVIAIVSYLGFTKAIPFQHHFTLHAVFQTSNNIKKGSPVRIAGVNVGKVASVSRIVNPDGSSAADVAMRINGNGLPIHRDATVAVRPRIFLEGNFFADLYPGTPSAPTVGDGYTLPVQQTSTPVQLDQILSALQSDTRTDLEKTLDNYSAALAGSGGRGFNLSTPYWKPAYQSTAQVSQALQGLDPSDLPNFLRYGATTAAAIDANPAQLQSLITDFNTTANSFAREQAALRAAIAELPRTLQAGIPALAALNRSFPPVRALVAVLRPAVRSSGPAIDALLPFIKATRRLVSPPELEGLVRDLRPTVPQLAQLNAAMVPLQEQVRAAASCQNNDILPLTQDKVTTDPTFVTTNPSQVGGNVALAEPVYQDQAKFLPGVNGESRSGDANGQSFRVLANSGNNFYKLGANSFFSTAAPLMGVNPPPPNARPPLNPNAPCENQQQPDLRTTEGAPPKQVNVATNSPSVLAATAKAQAVAVKWVADQLKLSKSPLKVSNIPITLAQIRSLHR